MYVSLGVRPPQYDEDMQVFLVKTNGLILAAYATDTHAQIHARTVTGAQVHEVEVLNRIPATVMDDTMSDEWDDTPTVAFVAKTDITQTQPDTPRAKAARKRNP
jgi:hypothetical protein